MRFLRMRGARAIAHRMYLGSVLRKASCNTEALRTPVARCIECVGTIFGCPQKNTAMTTRYISIRMCVNERDGMGNERFIAKTTHAAFRAELG
jgi:hypothetical protein